MDDKLSRRDVLQRSVAFGALTLVGATVACGKEQAKALSCSDTTMLSSTDALLRTTMAYVDSSTFPDKYCTKCIQFLPAQPNACGNCKVLKGPINPHGYCKSFAPKPA
ncbi:MAG: hypothetical protein ACREJ3_20375 [Polyangiaceae bacterium]